jgi:membrane-bound inhibitor of C-type lysozyme
MKILVPVRFATILLVSASASFTNTPTPARITTTSFVRNYRCDSGETIAATYTSTDSTRVCDTRVIVTTCYIAVSVSGARYAGDDLEWWTKGSGPGSEGTLFRHEADGTSGDIIVRCKGS